LIVVAAIGGVVWFIHNQQAPSPQTQGEWKTAIEHFRSDLATVHGSAARRVRSGEIQSTNDLFAFINAGMKKARARSFGDVGRALQRAIGKDWNAAAAVACDRMNLEIGRAQ
jgi:hypothetical protein